MRQEKSTLRYGKVPQVNRCFYLLGSLCEKVFISNRDDQREKNLHGALPQLQDQFSHIGPLAGLLTAMSTYPEVAWLILACDMPFVTEETLQTLTQKRNLSKMATAYLNPETGSPEPLCSIYEPMMRNLMLRFVERGICSLQRILLQSDIKILKTSDTIVFKNINTQQEYREAQKLFRRRNIRAMQISERIHDQTGG